MQKHPQKVEKEEGAPTEEEEEKKTGKIQISIEFQEKSTRKANIEWLTFRS